MLLRKPLKLGLIPASRGFFDATLAASMRREVIEACAKAEIELIVPSEEETRLGCVETIPEAEACAALFRRHQVDGILVVAVNFGSEQGAAWAVKKAALDVPILLFACQEDAPLTPTAKRRDAFCGLLSIAEALRQIGAGYSVAPRPVGFPRDAAFAASLVWFAGVCRVVGGIRNARYGQIGARPDAFWTCRYDEARLQRLGPTTVTLDLSEVIGAVNRMSDDDSEVQRRLGETEAYADTSATSSVALLKLAKLQTFLRSWGKDNGIDAFAIQCWTSIQQNFGVCACTAMSQLSDLGIPAACEADILGTLSMHSLQLAAGSPAALADWNNLHNDDDELVNLWHCGVFPKSFSSERPRLATHSILPAAGACEPEDAQGVVELVASPSPVTLGRVVQDLDGGWKVFAAQGAFETNAARTSGSYGWCRIEGLQSIYRNVLLRHFPHHVAVAQGDVGNILSEAFGNYLGMQVFAPHAPRSPAWQPDLPFPTNIQS